MAKGVVNVIPDYAEGVPIDQSQIGVPNGVASLDEKGILSKEQRPSYTADDVGLGQVDNTSDENKPISKAQADAIDDAKKAGTDAQFQLSEHEISKEAHTDIRDLLKGLSERVNTLLDSDDVTLDQLSEIVSYIKSNKSLIDSITNSKVNVTDIVNNLATENAGKPLSAAMGVELKRLIDGISDKISETIEGISDTVEENKKNIETVSNYLSASNLLINSDFSNPVNQLGLSLYKPTNEDLSTVYYKSCIDAWEIVYVGSVSVELVPGGIEVTDYNDIYHDFNLGISQDFDISSVEVGKKYTAALGYMDGSTYVESFEMIDGNSGHSLDSNKVRVSLRSSSYGFTIMVPRKGSVAIAWAALYEGEYTADTLPAYKAKGYAEELIVCKKNRLPAGERYTPQMFGAIADGKADDTDAMNKWFKYLGENRVTGYLPRGTYLVTNEIGFDPTVGLPRHRISFLGEDMALSIIKAGFARGNVLKFVNCAIGEIGNFTIDSNESVPNNDGITAIAIQDATSSPEKYSYIHDINIVNIGNRAGLFKSSSEDPNGNQKSIQYVNMERVHIVGVSADRQDWTENAPVGIIVADTSHFNFINCKATNINFFGFEFKNYCEHCAHIDCTFENCNHGIYLGQQLSDGVIGHKYYKAIGNRMVNVSCGITASKISDSTFDNNTIVTPDDQSNTYGMMFIAPSESLQGKGNHYYGRRYAVYFDGDENDGNYNLDSSIEMSIHHTTFEKPYVFNACRRCSVIASNYQTYAENKDIDENKNAYIPLVNVIASLP